MRKQRIRSRASIDVARVHDKLDVVLKSLQELNTLLKCRWKRTRTGVANHMNIIIIVIGIITGTRYAPAHSASRQSRQIIGITAGGDIKRNLNRIESRIVECQGRQPEETTVLRKLLQAITNEISCVSKHLCNIRRSHYS